MKELPKIPLHNPTLGKVSDTTIEIREKDQIGKTELSNPSTQEIIEQLQKSICTVFFYKTTTGSYRKMRCTLKDHTPVASKYNRQGVIVVWDLDSNSWKSFYANRVFKLIRNEQTEVQ
jgi:hypothetical protein